MINLTIKQSKKLGTEYSIFASFKYDADIVKIFRSLPTRYYFPDTQEWEVSCGHLELLCKELIDNGFEYELEGTELLYSKQHKIPENYTFKTKPFSHQIEAIEFGLNHDKWLLGDSMGLGKSKVAIDLACIKKQENGYKHCLIVCGVNGLKWNWANEIETHSNEDWYILGQRKDKSGNIKIKDNSSKLYDITHLEAISEYFIITNIETLRNDKCILELRKSALNDEINMIIFDEAHACKNPSSQQGKGMLKLSTKTMIAMTGTPLMNTPIDLYFVMKWLGYESHSFYAFKQYYCIYGGYGGYEIIGYRNLKQLQNTLNTFMIRRLKEDVFDLPEKIYINEYVELTPKQKLLYDEVKQDIQMNIDKIVMSNNPLTELIRLRQATGYTGILSSTIEESAKFDRVVELLEEAKSNNQKVVIFSNWTQVTEPLQNLLNKKHFYGHTITGDTDTFTRMQYVDEFQTSDKVDYILGTIGAMGTGITLTAGTIEIFLDEPWNMALKEQAVDRCHRIGTKNNITIYTMLAKNTIDERINNIVEHKGLMANAIVDGKINMDKKELISYLLLD